MSGWFRTPKQKLYAATLSLLTLVFGVLMTVSLLGDGTEILKKSYNETVFEEEEISPANVGTFTLESSKLCMLEVKGLTLDQSWLWVSAVILDDKDRPVLNYTFDLSHYHGYEGGESWSEGDKDDYKLFRLPAGSYKLMIHGEDEPSKVGSSSLFGINPAVFASNGYSTVDRHETIEVRVTKGIWMTRYFLIMFLVFGTLLCIYCYIRAERSKYEPIAGHTDEPQTYDGQAYYQQAHGEQNAGQSSYQSYSPAPKDPQHPNT